MSEQLYRKIMQGKRVTYKLYTPEPEDTIKINLTESQKLTAAGALGVTLLMVFERNMPKHKKIARKIKAVHDSILDLYVGTGQKIDIDIAEYFCKAWDNTIKSMSHED